jgi:hypothetical protein
VPDDFYPNPDSKFIHESEVFKNVIFFTIFKAFVLDQEVEVGKDLDPVPDIQIRIQRKGRDPTGFGSAIFRAVGNSRKDIKKLYKLQYYTSF